MVFQVGSTLLDACVLAALMESDMYGYILTQRIQEGIDISESTLYPVLRRLQKDGCLSTYDQSFQGRNRRYYTITPQGKVMYEFYLKEWKDYKNHIDKILERRENDD